MNPMQMMQMMNVLRHSNNPMAMLEQMANNNPNMQRAIQMGKGKNESELRTIAENLCKQRDVDASALFGQLGL